MSINKIGIIFLLTSLTFNVAFGKNYYFSSKDGNDKHSINQAQNISTPWKSITKLNEFTSQLLPGDSVLFKRGEVFYGAIILKESGTPLRPIVISAYGNGAKPVITGFKKLDLWTSIGNGIYESPYISGSSSNNMIVMNGIPQAMGRFPNSGYLSYESSTTNSITDKQLASSPNWTGADIVVRKNHWITDRNPISSHRGNSINFDTKSTYPGINGYGYFIQNDQRTLDSEGEWFFNPKSKSLLMYFGMKSPSSYTIKTATVDELLTVNTLNNIIIHNLSFEGSNKTAIQISDAQNIYVRNCNFDFSGANAITGSSIKNYSPGFKVEGCTINYSNNNAIDLDFSFLNASIKNNVIKNTATVAGMGRSGDGQYLAVYSRGANTVIEHNVIDRTGYSGIYFKGNSVVVKNNFVNNSCLVKDDGAGIYTYRDGSEPIEYGQKIISNIVLNSRGASEGTNPMVTQAQGIYLDGNTMNVEVFNNTAANCTDYGLFMNGSQNINVKGNTFYNNNIQFQMYNWGPGIRNLDVQDNIFFSKLKNQLSVDFYTEANDVKKFGNSDKNYFIRPMGDDFLFHTQSTANSYPGKIYTLSDWASTYHQDQNSKISPVEIPDYKIKSLTSKDKVPSDYLTNVNRSAVWPNDHSLSAKANKENKKSLRVSLNNNAVGDLVLVSIFNIGAVSSNKSYVLKYKAVSNRERSVQVYLSQTKAPYATLSEAQFRKVSSTATEVEVVFNMPTSDDDARIVFQLNGTDGPISLENIEFYEADVSVNKPDDYIRFEYNPTSAVKVISLDRPYVDAKNNLYENKVSLAPFSSVVLIVAGEVSDKSSQTISFPAMPEKVFEDTPFKLKASSSSGLAVDFKVISGPANIKDGIVTLQGAGKIMIEASQVGDSKYNAASSFTQSFNVNKAKQNIKFVSIPTKTYGDEPFGLSAYSSSGLMPIYRVVSGPATISGNTVTLTGAGTVTIEALHTGNNNYQESSAVEQSFSVASPVASVPTPKIAQRIDFSSISSLVFTKVAIKLKAISSSGLAINYVVLSGDAAVSGNLLYLNGAGIVAIEASQPGNSSYHEASSVKQSFNVLPETVSVKKSDQRISFWGVSNKNFGAAPFTLRAISSSGLPVSYRITKGPATISGHAVTLTGAGYVTVVCTQEGNEDYYAASMVSHTFKVAQTNQHIAFSSLPSQTYGNAPVTLDAYASSGLPITYKVLSGPATVSGNVLTLTGTGRVVIKALQNGNNDYKASRDVSRNFMVNKGRQDLSFSPQSESSINQSLDVINSKGLIDEQLVDEQLGSANTEIQLNTFPNPFKDRLNIVFIPLENGHATLKVYDLYGRMVKQLFEGQVNRKEAENFTFDALAFPTGIYIVRLTIADKTSFKKVVLTKE